MSKKITLLISLALLLIPLLLVSCGSNGTAITNVSNSPGDSSAPRLVADINNTLHLVWFDLSTGTNQIMYSEKSTGADWSKPVNISNSFSNSRGPKVMVDDDGTTHVVWYEYANGKFRIFYAQKPFDGSWSEPYNVTANREAATFPSAVLDSQGKLYVVWEEDKLKQDTELYYTDIFYCTRNVDGTWSEPVDISNNDGDSEYPSVVVDGQNNVHVLWEDNTSGTHQIYYSTLPSGGSWSEAVNISNSTADTSDPIFPVMAVDSQDTVHASWHDISLGNWEIMYAAKSRDGAWSPPSNISRNNSNSGVPALCIDNNDTVYLVWNDDSAGNFDIFYAQKPLDQSWGHTVNVSRTSEKSGDPCIAVDDSGSLYFVWSEYISGKNNWDIVYTSILSSEAE